MAVTINYRWPVTGVVAPTALQAKDTVSAAVIADADADTTATIVHNMGLSAAELALGSPLVIATGMNQAVCALSGWACTARNANNVVMTKGIGAGSGDAAEQLMVVVHRPHSIGR